MINNSLQAKSEILKHLAFEPTQGQSQAIDSLVDFLADKQDDILYLLKGYAGTGKTTLVSALIKALPALHLKSVLLAPTGRAAKVLSNYSEKQAFTIHKKIYRIKTDKFGGVRCTLDKNLHTNTIFIVDEASMIPDYTTAEARLFSDRSLLEDLFFYVSEGKNCRLLLLGDTAQLPPVGSEISPALDIDFLKNTFVSNLYTFELTEIVRQTKTSGVLYNATLLREKIRNQIFNLPYFELPSFSDIKKVEPGELEELLHNYYDIHNLEDTVVICRSNKRANIFNREIRSRILFKEEEISSGDYMMVVKNNYFWLPEDSQAGFIANGDVIELLRIGKIEDMYGFRFANVSIRLVDYPDHPPVEVKIILDTIYLESPSLSYADGNRLFEAVMEDYNDLSRKQERIQRVKQNPYFNALQVKFSYALTCHKTQGGQWDTVFLEQSWLPSGEPDLEYTRWLYTALTRAKKRIFLIGFSEKY